MIGTIRASLRLGLLLVWLGLWALPLVLAMMLTLGKREAVASLAQALMPAFCRGVVAILGVRVQSEGERPRGPCLVTANHWGYIDILALGTEYASRFVSMADVANWPVMGFFARASGTLFLERERRRDAHRVGGEVEAQLRRGRVVTVFLEGSSGDGRVVRKFKSSLVESAVECAVPCVPVAIDYSLPRNPELSPGDVIAWREHGFVGHLWRVLSLPRVDATVKFLAPRSGADRKELAAQLEQDVRGAMTTSTVRTPGP